MSEELELCPFCGVDVNNSEHADECYLVHRFDFQTNWAKYWNTRPLEDALRKQLEVANNENADLTERLSDCGSLLGDTEFKAMKLEGQLEVAKKAMKKAKLELWGVPGKADHILEDALAEIDKIGGEK
jgi:hypothetical protein